MTDKSHAEKKNTKGEEKSQILLQVRKGFT